jgi:hypothetical protein
MAGRVDVHIAGFQRQKLLFTSLKKSQPDGRLAIRAQGGGLPRPLFHHMFPPGQSVQHSPQRNKGRT